MNYPFSKSIQEQLQASQENLETLRAFAARYPDAKPVMISSLYPLVSFPAAAAGWCRSNLGKDGWEVTGSTATKEVDGVLVELRIERKLAEPFEL